MKTTLVLLTLLCTGCATLPGVEISDAEREACKAETCSVWTPTELQNVARKLFEAGYKAGVKSL